MAWRLAARALQQVDSLVATEERAQQKAQQRVVDLTAKLQDQRLQYDTLMELATNAVNGRLDLLTAGRAMQSATAASVSPSLPAALRPMFVWITAFIQQLRQPACLMSVLLRLEAAYGPHARPPAALVQSVLALFEHNLPADQARLAHVVMTLCSRQLLSTAGGSSVPFVAPSSLSGQLVSALLLRMPECRHYLDSVLSPVLEEIIEPGIGVSVKASDDDAREACLAIAAALCEHAAEVPVVVRQLATDAVRTLRGASLARADADAVVARLLVTSSGL